MKIVRHSPIIEEQMKKFAEDPYVIKEFFNKDEIQWLCDQESFCTKVEKRNKIINYKYPKLGKVEKFIEEKLHSELGVFKRHGGSYVMTPEPFHAHTDTGKADEMLDKFFPYKNILIPLVTSTEEKPLYTVFFNQRSFGQAAHFWKGEAFEEQKPVYNTKVTDYVGLNGYTDKNFSKAEHIKHLSHLPIESLFGLTVGQTLNWRCGDVIIFDCSQLHSSNNFSEYGVQKHFLSYFASKEIQL